MHVHFHTPDAGGQGAFQAWQAMTTRLFYEAARSPGTASAQVPVRLASMDLGGLGFMEVAAPPGVSTRDAGCLRRDGVDAMFVSVMGRGRARLEVGDRCVPQRPGDVVMWDAARQHRWIHETGISSTCVRIPRALLRVADPASLGARAVPGDSALGGLVAALVGHMSRLPPTVQGAAAHRLRSSLLDALVAALGTAASADAAAPGRHRLAQAKDYMLARLDDADLCVAQVARAVGSSERSLCRLFAAEGSTPMSWLWQQRLAHAHRLLAEAGAASVTEAALSAGFTSFSHFSRAFRRAYGLAPSALLAAG